jgi:hypothetical protein
MPATKSVWPTLQARPLNPGDRKVELPMHLDMIGTVDALRRLVDGGRIRRALRFIGIGATGAVCLALGGTVARIVG